MNTGFYAKYAKNYSDGIVTHQQRWTEVYAIYLYLG